VGIKLCLTTQKINYISKTILRICASVPSFCKHKVYLSQPCNQRSSHIPLFQSLKKLSVIDINKLQIAKFVHSVLNKISAPYFHSWFKTISTVHTHGTRTGNNVFVPYAKTNLRKFSIAVAGPLVWNTIPDDIRSIFNCDIFTSKLKTYLMNQKTSWFWVD